MSSYTCVCKRTFTTQNHYSQHQRSCTQTKKCLSSALTSFKDFVTQRKKPRVSLAPNESAVVITLPNVLPACRTNFADEASASPLPSRLEDPVSPHNPSQDSVDVHHRNFEGGNLDEEDMSLAQRRPRRQNRRLPQRFRDVLPQPPPTVPAEVRDLLPQSVGCIVSPEDRPGLPARSFFRTPANIFGLVRQYFCAMPPSHDPEEYMTMADLLFIPEAPQEPSTSSNDSLYHPYPNRSSFQLGNWYWNQGLQKSQADYTKLLDIMSASTFSASDVTSTCWKNINSTLGVNEYDKGDKAEWQDEDAGWNKTPVSIEVPFSCTTQTPGPRTYEAAHLYHRSLVAVLREKLSSPRDDKLFHYEPYQLRWTPPHLDAEVAIHGDLYTSPVFHEAHTELQESPGEPGCDLPRVVAGVMFWSDATQLTSFGNAKLWPTYMYFGNESKYRRCKPSCNLSNHVAYFETLPDSFKDFTGGKGMTSECATHCHREFFHVQWKILLDDEFLEAYEHGIVICCCDGIKRRFYPRIFTYSADYPEK
ncbi:hypothetical protein EV424DRAFT_1321096 [Suillus variegatus]|nr:hypothetical protein EV424DRAFT_1321096 [Suillus variegatus]